MYLLIFSFFLAFYGDIKVSEIVLSSLGIVTCEDMLERRVLLYLAFKEHTADWLVRLMSEINPLVFLGFARCRCSQVRAALGMGGEAPMEHHERRSISVSRTFRELRQPDQLLLYE